VSNENKHIDKLFKDTLNQRHFDVSETFLEDLNNRLNQKQKKRKIFWLFLTIPTVGLLLTGTFFVFNNQESKSENILLQETEEFSSRLTEVNNEVKIVSHVDETKRTLQSKIEHSKATIKEKKQENKNISTQYIDDSDSKQLVEKHELNNLSNKNDSLISNKHSGINDTLKTSNPLDLNKEEEKAHSNIETEHLSISTESLNDEVKSISNFNQTKTSINISEDNNIKEPINNPKVFEENFKHTSVEMFESELDNMALSDTIITTVVSKDSIYQDEIEIAKVNDTSVRDSSHQNTVDSTLIDKTVAEDSIYSTKKPWHFDLQVFGGVGSSSYIDKSNNELYLNEFKENQKNTVLFNAGILGSITYQNFTLRTGIEFSQTGEKFDFELNDMSSYDSTISSTNIVNQLISYYEPWGAWKYDTIVEEIITSDETVTITDTVKSQMIITNRYNWISVPISVGYQFNWNKFSVIPRVGTRFNFAFSRDNGKLPSEDYLQLEENTFERFTIDYSIDLEFRRDFTNWHVFLSPYFRSNFKPTINSQVLQRKYSTWGVNLGIGYRF